MSTKEERDTWCVVGGCQGFHRDGSDYCEEHKHLDDDNGRPPVPIEVGDDEITRREKAMGLDIDPKTNRAYQSQGDFHNMGLGYGGHFRDGAALPSAFRCVGCDVVVMGTDWRGIYENCSGVTVGTLRFATEFPICRECTMKVLHLFPTLKGIIKAMHGGDLKRG